MTRLRLRLRALSTPELQTIGYIVGLGSLVWWVVGRITPPSPVAGIVASLLFLQRLFPRVKKEPKRASNPAHVGDDPRMAKDTDRRDKGMGDSGFRRRRLARRHRRPLTLGEA